MTTTASGVLELLPRGGGFLRDPAHSFRPTPNDPFVSPALTKRYGLVSGATVAGPVGPGKKSPQLTDVSAICGSPPAAFKTRTLFGDLVAINPDRRFRLGDSGNISMRLVDLMAPIARGTRGLIVAAPKTGKT